VMHKSEQEQKKRHDAFVEVNAAFTVIGDPEKRKFYDLTRGGMYSHLPGLLKACLASKLLVNLFPVLSPRTISSF
jgi:curved DNA-binding protein CbpA